MTELFYFHDPMCSWCWGFRPTLQRLLHDLSNEIAIKPVVGGLAPDSDAPMPGEQRLAIQDHWRRIEALLGTGFNHEFWLRCEPRRSTYPSCRAVIAAAYQGQGEAMTLAIQKAYYLEARNPSDSGTLIELAAELALDVDTFRLAFESDDVDAELQRQVSFCRLHGVSGFPSLGLMRDDVMNLIDIDYTDHKKMLGEIEKLNDT